MADDSVFPLVLAIREDGSVESTMAGFEQSILASTTRAAGGFQSLRRQVDELRQSASQKVADPLGIGASLRSLSASPIQKAIEAQIGASNALAEQQRRTSAERVQQIGREFDAAMSGIRAEQAARTEALQQVRRDQDVLSALQQQRAAEAARLVAAPAQQQSTLYFDPRGSQQAAVAARAQAGALAIVAREAENVTTATNAATAADRAFAVAARAAAAAAGEEAGRLEEVAATQGRVAAAITSGGAKAVQGSDLLTNSIRGQRVATIQASQQFQDFFIQIQGGTNPLIALSQQGSQLAFVLANSGGQAGKFASFMAGGWGTAIFAGISVLSLLSGYLGTHKTAQDDSAAAADRMAKHQQALGRFIDETTGRIKEQNAALVINQALELQQDAKKLGKQYEQQRANLLRQRDSKVVGVGPDGSPEVQAQRPEFVAALDRYAAGGSAQQLAIELNNIGKARPQIAATAAELVKLTAGLVGSAREYQSARAARKVLLGDANESTRRIAFGDFSPPTVDTAKLRADAAAAAIDQGTSALRAATARRAAALAQLNKDFSVKGGVVPEAQASAYQARATAIEAQYNREKEAAEAANKARSEAASTARRVAGEHRQELFADARAIGDGADVVQAANSIYAAEITRLRNQLREGIITDDQAQAAAVRARQIRNAAVDAAQGAKLLGDSLQRISQEYDGDSRFVNRIEKAQASVAAAIKRLDPLTGTAKIGEREYTRDDLNGLNGKLADAYSRPITDATRQLRDQAEVQAQILAGNQDEADFLRLKTQLLTQYGDLLPEERAKLEALIEPLRGAIVAEKDRNAEIERRGLLINVQVAAARRLQDAFTTFFQNPFAKGSLTGLGDALTKSRQQQVAEQISIKLFGGDLGSRVHDALTRGSAPLRSAADRHIAAADALIKAAGALTTSASAANDNVPTLAERTTTPSAFGVPGLYGPATTDQTTGDIVVTGNRTARQAIDGDFGGRLTVVGTGLTDLSDTLTKAEADQRRRAGVVQAQTIALSLAAQAIGGKGGAAVNALLNANTFNQVGKDIAKQIGGGLGSRVGNAVQGYGIGQATGSILDLIGVKGTKTGSAIGGTVGGAAFGPLGAIGGSVLGGLIGSLFYKAPKGQAGISVANGGFGATSGSGTSAAAIAQANSLAGAVSTGLQSIADQLGGIIGGSTDVQIGTYKDQIRVNDHGGAIGGVKGSGAISFATEQAAISYAIQDAIRDGVITGLSAGSQQLIRVGANLDRQIQKALSFEGVFTQLRALKDPIGAANEALDKELANMRAIFTEAGATATEQAQLEELYGLKRAEALKQAQQQVTGQLQDLLDSLNYRGDSGLSLRTRETNASAALAPLIAQITAGKTVDQGQYSAAAQAYLDIERQLYGSTSKYFDALSNITGLTQRAITNTGAPNVTSIADATAKAAQAAADAAVASQTSFTIPQDRVAMMTAGQLADAFSSGLEDHTAAITATLNAGFTAQTRQLSKAITDSTSDSDAGLPMIMALRNA